MKCRICKARLKVIDSRMFGDDIRIRKYKCPECEYTAVTSETLPELPKKEKKPLKLPCSTY